MRNIIVTLGILIALVPFLGFPGMVENIFFVFAGLGVAIAAYYGGITEEKCKICKNKITHNVENNKAKNITTKENS